MRKVMDWTALGISLALGAPAAYAQTEPSPSVAAESVGLDEIIVTAQHRTERAQDVPISISSISGAAIEASGYQSLTDLQNLVPGVQYDPTNGAAFQIRGVGSTSFDFSNEKSVNVVVDDVVMDAQRANGLIGLNDISSVDVLMGPQGTLFGKNSTSGAIVVRTNDPELGAYSVNAYASYGERNDHTVTGTVNIPLGETAALRFSAFEQGQDGYGRYVVLNEDLGRSHEYGARIKLRFEPNSDLDIQLSGDYARHHDSFIRTAVAPPSFIADLLDDYGVVPGPTNADSADTSFGGINTSEAGASLRASYQLGEHTLTSITAYRETIYDNRTPANLLPGDVYAYIPFNQGHLDTEKFSQELRLASPTGNFFEYLGGVYFNTLDAEQTQLQWATLGAPLVSGGVPNTSFIALTGAIGEEGNTALFQSTNETLATYGQVKFNFTDALSLALGARYTTDENSQSLDFVTTPAEPIIGVPVTFTAISLPPVAGEGSVSGENFSYRIAPQYRLSDDVMLYASYSTGYKPGGVAFVGNRYAPYREETVEAFEVGIKSELFDRRLRLNFDIFSSEFTDFQATILTPVPDGGGGFVNAIAIGNAGALKSEGAELTFAWQATDALSFRGGVTYTDARFTDYVYNDTTDYTGTRLTNAPRWSGFIGVDYEHQISSALLMNAHLDYAYRDKLWTVVGQPDYSEVPSYGLLNGRVSFQFDDSPVEFGIYARNLNDTYFSTGWQEYGALGLVHYTSANAYRTAGVFLRYAY